MPNQHELDLEFMAAALAEAHQGLAENDVPIGSMLVAEDRRDRGEFVKTVPLDAHPGGASPYGVGEMASQVEEWCADWYAAYPGSTYRSGAYSGSFKVLRGGSSFFTHTHARCAYRCFTRPEDAGLDGLVGCGFRRVRERPQ